MITLALAIAPVPSPVPAGITPDQAQQMLMDSLAIAKTIPWPAVGAIFVVLILTVMAVLQIAAFFRNEDQRRAAAYAESLRIQSEQLQLTEKVQRDASQALRDNMDAAFADDYKYFVKQLTAKNYPAIWGKIPAKMVDKVGVVVYNEQLTPDDRAGRMILILKQQA